MRTPSRCFFLVLTVLLPHTNAIGQYVVKEPSAQDAKIIEQVTAIQAKGWALARADKYDEAITITEEARSLTEQFQDLDVIAVWIRKEEVLKDLGTYHYSRGNYKKAEEYLLLASKLRDGYWKKQGVTEPPYNAHDFALFGIIHEAAKDMTRALEAFRRAIEISGKDSAFVFNLQTEQMKLKMMRDETHLADWIVSFNLQSAKGNPEAARLASTVILRRKGRVAGSIGDLFQALRHYESESTPPLGVVPLMNQYFAANANLSNFYLKTDDSTARTQYAQEANRYERQTTGFKQLFGSSNNLLFNLFSGAKPEPLETFQQAVPRDSVLIEFVLYSPFDVRANQNSKRWGEPRYAAYIIKPAGDPVGIDLGPASEINTDIANFRAALNYPSGDIKERARTLDLKIMAPIRTVVGNTQTFFLAPDGQLNLVPFTALVNEKGDYLIEKYSFRYLTSGRDLLWMREKDPTAPSSLANELPPLAVNRLDRRNWEIPRRQGPVIFADPDFSAVTESAQPTQTCSQLLAATSSGQAEEANVADTVSGDTDPVSVGRFNFQFSQIPFTRAEAAHICGYLPGVTLHLGPQATEARLKAVTGPSILHIATHGYFITDIPPDFKFTSRFVRDPWWDVRFPSAPSDDVNLLQDPLLRSGLALGGANRLSSSNGQDGINTALEMAGLDLWGTKLVVLSACQTGNGEIQNGEGVFGLRRALVIAGAESQVISLWSIEDQSTTSLMVEYYRRLASGEGRSEALRTAQLAMLRGSDQERQHPYYWAGFIQSGAWTSISLGRPSN